jgi:hypothetical protein
LEEAVKRLTIAGTTAWDTPDEAKRSWIHMQLASAQVLATIAVAEALERLATAKEPTNYEKAWESAWARGLTAGWTHRGKDAAEEVAELTPTQTEEPF